MDADRTFKPSGKRPPRIRVYVGIELKISIGLEIRADNTVQIQAHPSTGISLSRCARIKRRWIVGKVQDWLEHGRPGSQTVHQSAGHRRSFDFFCTHARMQAATDAVNNRERGRHNHENGWNCGNCDIKRIEYQQRKVAITLKPSAVKITA